MRTSIPGCDSLLCCKSGAAISVDLAGVDGVSGLLNLGRLRLLTGKLFKSKETS